MTFDFLRSIFLSSTSSNGDPLRDFSRPRTNVVELGNKLQAARQTPRDIFKRDFFLRSAREPLTELLNSGEAGEANI